MHVRYERCLVCYYGWSGRRISTHESGKPQGGTEDHAPSSHCTLLVLLHHGTRQSDSISLCTACNRLRLKVLAHAKLATLSGRRAAQHLYTLRTHALRRWHTPTHGGRRVLVAVRRYMRRYCSSGVRQSDITFNGSAAANIMPTSSTPLRTRHCPVQLLPSRLPHLCTARSPSSSTSISSNNNRCNNSSSGSRSSSNNSNRLHGRRGKVKGYLLHKQSLFGCFPLFRSS